MTEGQVTEALIRLKFSNHNERKLNGERIASSIQLGRKCGSLRVLENCDKIQGGYWEFETTQYFPSVKVRILDFALNSKNKTATNWIKRELRKRTSGFDQKTFIFLDEPRFALLKSILSLGFSIESLILKGKTGPALAALMRAHRPPKDLSHLGLEIQKVKANKIDEIVLLHRREFRRNPQYGWFCANKGYLEHLKSEISEDIKKSDHCHYVILQEDEVVGYFAATIGSGQRKRRAGVSFAFDQSIQGRGIVKTAYRILLEDMRKRKVEAFIGGTSQKAILGLAKVMKRRPSAYILRFGPGAFSQRYFGKW